MGKSLYLQFWMIYGYQIYISGTAFGEESTKCSCSGTGKVSITCSQDFGKYFCLQLSIGYIHQIQATGAPFREEFIGHPL